MRTAPSVNVYKMYAIEMMAYGPSAPRVFVVVVVAVVTTTVVIDPASPTSRGVAPLDIALANGVALFFYGEYSLSGVTSSRVAAAAVARRRARERTSQMRVRTLTDAGDIRDKVALVRVDHNCVKKGVVKDVHRIERTLPTLYNIVERGARPILMTHVNRPRGKDGVIDVDEVNDGVGAVANVLRVKLGVIFAAPTFKVRADGRGIDWDEVSMSTIIEDLRARRIGGVYLPNTRWFDGEEAGAGTEACSALCRRLADLADIYVNDAFGSWQPHASTVEITKYLPSYAGLCMERELRAIEAVLEPKRPFVAIVGGAKVDTKLGTLRAVAKRCDTLILGGVVYNAYLCAKYGIEIEGVSEKDVELAAELLHPEVQAKLVELPIVVESSSLQGCGCVPKEGVCSTPGVMQNGVRAIRIDELQRGASYGYFLDVAASAFDDERVKSVLSNAASIFVNAVMGFTSSGFHEGTTALDHAISSNKLARKYFGGGDTIQEFKSLSPALYLSAVDDPTFYLFTGGGTVLKTLELGGAEELETVKCLLLDKDEETTHVMPKCMALAECDCTSPLDV